MSFMWSKRYTNAILPIISLSLFTLISISLYTPVPGGTTGINFIFVIWDSLLHISSWVIITFSSVIALCVETSVFYSNRAWIRGCRRRWPLDIVTTSVVGIALFFAVAQSIQSQLQILDPSWKWNPCLWGFYRVYEAVDIPKALDGICLDSKGVEGGPLCLSKLDWRELSSGMLSSDDPNDIHTVMQGISFAKNQSGGLAILIMSRDTVDFIPTLRFNVEGMVPFFPKVSVIIFENDSKDGSRDAFKAWSRDAKGYRVDLMDCPEAPDCKFGESHRYESIEAVDYFKSSAVGRMAEFRQRMIDYVNASPEYTHYSHLLVMDLDIGVSISPLGILHSLGALPDQAVASASRQVWPGSFGTLTPPYDFAPFRAQDTPPIQRLLYLTRKICELSPPGDRWRNQCESVSPFHTMLILALDRSGTQPYRVHSAYNGATLYPLPLVRETEARYDAGPDGQRCEHVGFHLHMKDKFYINPKWRMHLSPKRPGGPDGKIAMKNISRIVMTPKISFLIFFQNLGCMILLVHCTMILVLRAAIPGMRKARMYARLKGWIPHRMTETECRPLFQKQM